MLSHSSRKPGADNRRAGKGQGKEGRTWSTWAGARVPGSPGLDDDWLPRIQRGPRPHGWREERPWRRAIRVPAARAAVGVRPAAGLACAGLTVPSAAVWTEIRMADVGGSGSHAWH